MLNKNILSGWILLLSCLSYIVPSVHATLNSLPSGFAKKVESGWLPAICERGESMPDPIIKQWAERRSGAKVRVLFITGKKRGMFECLSLAKSFDFECDVIPSWSNWKLSNRDKDLWNLLRYYLSFKQYDVIAVSGIWLSYLPEDCQQEIASLIKNQGVGFVYAMHGIFPRVPSLGGTPSTILDPLLPLDMNISSYKKLTQRAVPIGNHSLTSSQDFSEIRWMCNVDTDLREGATPLLQNEDGTRILAAVATRGKGRVMAYNPAYGEHSKGRPFFLPLTIKKYSYSVPGSLMDIAKKEGMGKFSRWMNGIEYADQFYGWLGKCIIWAAKADSNVSLKSVTVNGGKINISITTPRKSDRQYNLHVVSRSVLHSRHTELDRSLVLDSKSYTSILPLPSTGMLGKHFLDVYLLDNDGEVLDWNSSSFDVLGNLKVIYKPDYSVYNPSDIIKPTFHLLVAPESKKVKVSTELFDLKGRLLIKQEKEVNVSQTQNILDIPLSLNLSDTGIQSRLANVRFTFSTLGESIEIRDQFFVKQSPGWDEYHIMAYEGFGSNPMSDVLCAVLEKSGHDTIQNGYPTPVLSRLSTETGLRNWGNWLIRRGSTPEKMKCLIGWFKDFSPVKYEFCDEPELERYPALENRFASSKYKTNFQIWLKKKYSNIATLNKAWGTQYKEWGDVVRPLWYETIDSDNWTSWFDSRRNLDDQFISTYVNASKAVRNILPNADTAINPRSIGTFSGINLGDFSRSLGSSYLYNDFVKGNSPMGYLHLGWRWFDHVETFIGYTWATAPGAERIAHEAWDAARRGANIGWFAPCFTETPPLADWSYFNGDFTLNEKGKAIAAINKVLCSGMGDLAVNTKPLDEGILVYYPRTLFYNNDLAFFKQSLLNKPQQDRKKLRGMSVWGANQMPNSFLPHLDALGYQYEFCDELDLTAERLKKTRVVLLQNVVCLGHEKLELLRDFVESGGCVIAEAGTARRDENGRVYAQTPESFKDLFGIERTKSNPSPLVLRESFRIVSKDANDSEFTSGNYGQVFRKGNAFFINFPMPKSNGEIRLLDKLLMAAGVEPTYGLHSNWLEVGTRSNLICSTIVRTQGKLTYLFLTGDGNKTDNVFSVKLPEFKCVYDVLADKNLGTIDVINGNINYSEARLFALSPSPVRSFTLASNRTTIKPGEWCELRLDLTTEDGAPDNRLVMLKISPTRKGVLPFIPRKVMLNNGKATLKIMVPYNVELGQFNVTARDLTSGIKANVIMDLRR